MSANEAQVAAAQEALYDLIVDDPMWIGEADQPLNYSPEREARIGEFLDRATRAVADAVVAAGTDQATTAAEALTQAADAWQSGEGLTVTAPRGVGIPAIDYAQRTLDWLRARAALASAGRPSDGARATDGGGA